MIEHKFTDVESVTVAEWGDIVNIDVRLSDGNGWCTDFAVVNEGERG